MLKDTKDRFGWISIALHWSSAILILALLYFGVQIALDYYYSIQFGLWNGGFVLEGSDRPPPGSRWPMIQFAVEWHEALGIIAIPILLFRVFWRLGNGKPVTHHQPRLPHLVAEWVWRILLIGMVWQVVSGPVWLWWRGHALPFFHYFELPTPWPLASPEERFERREAVLNYFLEYSHLSVGLLIGAVVLLHALGALKHHFRDRDDVLRRMLSPGHRVDSKTEHLRAKARMSAEPTNLLSQRIEETGSSKPQRAIKRSDQRTVLVAGATGAQGGATAKALLARGHAVIAMTRNPNSDAARSLETQGVMVRSGDFNDEASISRAADAADTAFVVTTPREIGTENEVVQGKTMVNALHDAGIGHIVFSSVASADQNTGIPHFDSKYQVELHLATLRDSYSILAPVYFMENLISPWGLPALRQGLLSTALPANRSLQQVAVRNIGEFAAALIDRREAVFGKRYDIAGDELTNAEAVRLVAQATGRDTAYQGFSPDVLRKQSEDLVLMFEWFERVGYSVNIVELRQAFPEVPWLTYKEWLAEQDWRILD